MRPKLSGKADIARSVTASYGAAMTRITGSTHSAGSARPRLVVSPERPSLDTELHIRLHDLPAGGEVTLRASLRDPRGCEWRSSATFSAAADGTVDLHRDAPVHGSYQTTDPMGLIWSMTAAGEPRPEQPADALAPTPLRLAVEVGGVEVADAHMDRLRVPEGLRRTDVREHGLVGTLYHPDGDDPLPGVLLLGGSEGGMHEDDAALLAAHGFAAMALAYYGLPGLPATLQDIPLEYFGKALDYLQRHPHVRADRLAVIGGSKGGEASLLVGAMFPQVRAVVSVVGSGLVTQGISGGVLSGSLLDILSTPVASWTYRGRALPYLPNVVTPELRAAVAAGEPVALRSAFGPALLRADLIPAATIPVERVRGAVLLISSDDDQGYGLAFHDAAERRLAALDHPHSFEHIVYQEAGHHIAAPPYAPTTRSLSPGPGVLFRGGGTPAGNARARADAWRRTLRFLARELAA
jgi:dienelactone hydrolase